MPLSGPAVADLVRSRAVVAWRASQERLRQWMGQNPERVLESVERFVEQALVHAAEEAAADAVEQGESTVTLRLDLRGVARAAHAAGGPKLQALVREGDVRSLVLDLARSRGLPLEGTVVVVAVPLDFDGEGLLAPVAAEAPSPVDVRRLVAAPAEVVSAQVREGRADHALNELLDLERSRPKARSSVVSAIAARQEALRMNGASA